MSEEYGYYFRDSPTQKIDVYRVLTLFGVTHPALQHAIKKLLVAGGRGAKDAAQDVHEAIGALQRWQQMQREELKWEPTHDTTPHPSHNLKPPEFWPDRKPTPLDETGKSTT